MKKRWIGILLAAALVAAQPASAFAAQSPNTNTTSTTGTTTANAVSVEGASASGTAVIGDTQIGFATGEAATAGLPAQTVAAINAINAGNTLADVVKDVDLNGYSALTSVQAIVAKDVNTNQPKTGEVAISLYVPNLIQGLNNVQVLFYDNATGLWKLVNPANVDVANKKITVNISGSGSFSVVYKK